jgi:hypothetical protein
MSVIGLAFAPAWAIVNIARYEFMKAEFDVVDQPAGNNQRRLSC